MTKTNEHDFKDEKLPRLIKIKFTFGNVSAERESQFLGN